MVRDCEVGGSNPGVGALNCAPSEMGKDPRCAGLSMSHLVFPRYALRHDPDPDVRNNAVRALGVIASSSQQRASMIPPKPFIALLKSEKWVDRNKGGWLMINLTESRDPKLLKQLRTKAMEALVEMARWRNAAHASFARRLLGRIAGIEEAKLDL